MQNLLIIEDDLRLQRMLSQAFQNTYTVFACSTLGEGNKRIETFRPDLVLADVILPDGNTLSSFTELKAKAGCPIILISGSVDNNHVVQGLDLGAVDFLVKPFSIQELLARVRRILRASPATSTKFDDEWLQIDVERKFLVINGSPASLSGLEWKLIAELLKVSPDHVPLATLEKTLWGGQQPGSRRLGMLISRLRLSLGERSYINTSHGVGVAFQACDQVLA